MSTVVFKSAIVTLAATSVLLSLLVAEFSLRWFAPVNLKAISMRVEQNIPGLRRDIYYQRDELGLRRMSGSTIQKSPSEIRILCVGASTTDQPTQDTHNTWCAQLQILLQARFYGQHIVVQTAAFAQGGWRIADLVARVPDILNVFDPDIVITLMGVNDLAFNGGPEYDYDGIGRRIASIKSREVTESYGFWNRCEALSQLCRRIIMLRKQFYIWRQADGTRSLEWHSRNLPNLQRDYQQYEYVDTPQRKVDPLREFSDGMEAMLSLLERRSITTVVLGQPVLWNAAMSERERLALWFFIETPAGKVRPSGWWLHKEIGRFNTAQEVIAQRHGAHYLDLDARIPKDMDHYFDDCHFTDLGSQRVAQEILPVVTSATQRRLSAGVSSS